jgi:hypothetical protein
MSGYRYIRKGDFSFNRKGNYYYGTVPGFRFTTEVNSGFGMLRFMGRDNGKMIYHSEEGHEVHIRA